MRYEICKIIYQQLLVWAGIGWCERAVHGPGIDYQSAYYGYRAILNMTPGDKKGAIVLRF